MVSAARRKKNNRIDQRKKDKAKLSNVGVTKEPHSIVMTRGGVSLDLRRLSHDFQKVMEPNTASRLQSTRKNSIKDFVSVSGMLDLTHLVIFTQTTLGMYLKLCRIPQGPTITFKIVNYTRAKDVLASLKKIYTHSKQFKNSPCIMTNLQPYDGDLHLQVTARMFQDMFPTITPGKVTPSNIRRCCLFNYDPEKELIDFRHYAIRVVPVEVSKGLKKMMGHKVPDLSRYTDVSEYMAKAGMLSDSEAEDDPNARVTVPHEKSKGLPLKSSIRLTELGPRITLQVYKVEAGLQGGQVLYHSFIIKTAEEKLKLEEEKSKIKNLKAERKKRQQKYVEAKKKGKEEHKQKCLAGMRDTKEVRNTDDDPEEKCDESRDADDEDDDAEYYRKEVGEEPDPDFFNKKRRKPSGTTDRKKKFKSDNRNIKRAQIEKKKVKAKKSFKGDMDFEVSKKKKKFKRK